MKKYKVVLRGLLGYIPGFLEFLKDRKEHSGSINARYCYSVWLRHLLLLNKVEKRIPDSVAELGPGASLGVGIAALISGVEKYFAFDIIKHTNIAKNKEVFYELVELFKNKTPLPNEEEFPSLKPFLDSYDFPTDILPDKWLRKVLDRKRLDLLEKCIDDLERDNFSSIKYFVPWNDKSIIQKESVDFIISQAVMEHVIDLDNTYHAMSLWLKKDG